MATIQIYDSEIAAQDILESSGIETNRTVDGIEVSDNDAEFATQVLDDNRIIYHLQY